jgi:hypothetical protein
MEFKNAQETRGEFTAISEQKRKWVRNILSDTSMVTKTFFLFATSGP